MTKRKIKQLLAKERGANDKYRKALEKATSITELAAKRHGRHQRLVGKLYRKLARANRKLEVANESLELVVEKWRFLNQLVAEMITTSEKRTFQNVTATKAMEQQLRQAGYLMELDQQSQKMLDAVEENGKAKGFRRG